ncbi:hypothetical protein ACJJTC_012605 [Scirpophaga incertulas]
MTTRGKERLVYHDYTYYKQSRTRNGFRWGCTKNRWHRCKAYLHLADDMTVVRSNMEHTHDPFVMPVRKHFDPLQEEFHKKFTILSSQRGGEVLLRDGYRYNLKRRSKNGRVSWRCVNRKGCSALLLLNSDATIAKEQDHKCEPSVFNNIVKEKMEACIARICTESKTPVSKIFSETFNETEFSEFDASERFPNFKNIKKTLYKHRRQIETETEAEEPSN